MVSQICHDMICPFIRDPTLWVTEVAQTYKFPARFDSAVNGNSYFWGKGSLLAEGERTNSIKQESNIVVKELISVSNAWS